MSNLTTINQLKAQFNIENFALKTVNQINKDLNGLIVDTLVFSESNDNLDMINHQLLPIIKELDRVGQLQQFIYQVDLAEKQWMFFINNQDVTFLSHQIIIREAQKVYLREMFR